LAEKRIKKQDYFPLAIASTPSDTWAMDTFANIGDFIRQQREAAEVSVRQLAKAAGVSNPYLSQIERGLRKPSAEILQQLAKALSVSAETLYVRAGLLDEDSSRKFTAETIANDPDLTDEQKTQMLEMYSNFLLANSSKES
jgi:transcriptional regulator with XRE-family HTH domain